MMSWVAGVVRVMPHWICRLAIRSVSTENGSGGSSPGCISSAAQSIVVPSSRGGVPVLRRPSAKPARSSVRDRPIDGASPTRPAGICRSPIWMRPRRKVPVVSTTAPAPNMRPSARRTPVTRASTNEVIHLAFDDRQIRRLPDRRLHRRCVKLAVGLGARAAHRRSLAAIEHAKLDAAGIRDAAHQAVERIDLANQMALAEPADGRIAGHRADGGEALGDQRRARAHPRRCGGRLAAGMAAADDNHIEAAIHRHLQKARPF